MPLQRLNPGPRMSQAVLIGDTAFLAGQVPTDLTGDIAKFAPTYKLLVPKLGGGNPTPNPTPSPTPSPYP